MMIDSSNQLLNSLLNASMMMAAVGALTFLLLKGVSIYSWRLRSCLAAAVLLQGVMIFRAPVHLGLIESSNVMPPVPVQSFDSADGFENGMSFHESHDAQTNSIVASNPSAADAYLVPRVVRPIDWSLAFTVIWLGVIAAIGGVSLYRYLSLLKQIRGLRSAPPDWQDTWKSLLRRSRSISDIGCCEMLVSQTAGPVIVRGLRKYRLIVPAGYWRRLSDEQRQAVMLHELAHLERRDVWRQLLVRIVALIHWVNPVAWWAVRQFELAAEHACDQRVAAAGKRSSTGFAAALVELVQWNEQIQQTPPLDDVNSIGPGICVQAMAAPR